MKSLNKYIILIFSIIITSSFALLVNDIFFDIRLKELDSILERKNKKIINLNHSDLIQKYRINTKLYNKKISIEEASRLELDLYLLNRYEMENKNKFSKKTYDHLSKPAVALINFFRSIVGKDPIDAIDKKMPIALYKIANYYERNLMYNDAITNYEKLVIQSKELNITKNIQSDILLHLGFCYSMTGDFEKAREYFKELIDKYSWNKNSDTASILLDYMGDFERKKDFVLEEKNMPEKVEKLFYLLAYDDALRVLNHIRKKIKEKDRLKFEFIEARCLEEVNKKKEAVSKYQKIILSDSEASYSKSANRRLFIMGEKSNKNNLFSHIALNNNAPINDTFLQKNVEIKNNIMNIKNKKDNFFLPPVILNQIKNEKKFSMVLVNKVDDNVKKEFTFYNHKQPQNIFEVYTSDGDYMICKMIQEQGDFIHLKTPFGNSKINKSDIIIIRTPYMPPEGPSGLFSPKITTSTIILQWYDNSENENGFIIERSNDGITYNKISKTSDNMTAFLDIGLKPGTSYYYKVWSFNLSGPCKKPEQLNVSTLPLEIASNLKKWVNNNNDIVNVNFEGKVNKNGLYNIWQFTEKIENIYNINSDELNINTFKSYNAYYIFDENKFYLLYGKTNMPFFIHPFEESGHTYSYNHETGNFYSSGANISRGKIKFMDDNARLLFYNNKNGNSRWEYMTLERVNSLSGIVMGRDNQFTAQDLFFFTAEFEASNGDREESDPAQVEIYIEPTDGLNISRKNPAIATLFQWGEYNTFEAVAFGATPSKNDPIILKRIPDGVYWLSVYQKKNILSQNFNLENNENYTIHNGMHFDRSLQIIDSNNAKSQPEPIVIGNGNSINLTVPLGKKYKFFGQDGIEAPEKQLTAIKPSIKLIDNSIEINVTVKINDGADISKIEGVRASLSSARSYSGKGKISSGNGQLMQIELDGPDYYENFKGSYKIAGYEEAGLWKLSEIEVLTKDRNNNYITITYDSENFGKIFQNYIYKEKRQEQEFFPQVIKPAVNVPTVTIPGKLVPNEDILSPELQEITVEISEPATSLQDRVFNESNESIIFSVYADDSSRGKSGLHYCKLYLLTRDDSIINNYVIVYLDQVDGNKISGELKHERDTLNYEYPAGVYDLVMLDIFDNAGNSSRYSIYDNEVYDVVDLEFLGLNENYCGYNFEKSPAILKTDIPLITIFKN